MCQRGSSPWLWERFAALDALEDTLLMTSYVHKYFNGGRVALVPITSLDKERQYDSKKTQGVYRSPRPIFFLLGGSNLSGDVVTANTSRNDVGRTKIALRSRRIPSPRAPRNAPNREIHPTPRLSLKGRRIPRRGVSTVDRRPGNAPAPAPGVLGAPCNRLAHSCRARRGMCIILK